MSDKLKTHKFARKPFYVDAVRVSEENIERVAEWCGGEIKIDEATPDKVVVDGVQKIGVGTPEARYIKVKVHRPITERQSMAFIGDWVLFAGTGYKVYTPKAFDKSFEKVRTLTKAQADEAGITVPHEPSQKPKPAEAAENTPFGTDSNDRIADHVLLCHNKRNDENWVCSCPPKPAEISGVVEAPVDVVFTEPTIIAPKKKDSIDRFLDEVARS